MKKGFTKGRFALLVLLCGFAVLRLPAEPRVALVIGNGAYRYNTLLKNPINDAQDIAGALEEAGFDVILKTDATLDGLHQAVREFGLLLKEKKGTGLFFYSGHGVQVKGKNYLLPVDQDIQEADEVAYKALDAEAVLAKMESAGNALNLVFLDACRNNPFPGASRSGDKGLAVMRVDLPESVIVFAAEPGKTAEEGEGMRNSPFTQAFLSNMRTPDQDILTLMKKVKAGVSAATGGKQSPRVDQNLSRDFIFFRSSGSGVSAAAKPPAFRVGFVCGPSDIDDQSFNQGVWEGLVRFGTENGLVRDVGYGYRISASEREYPQDISAFLDERTDLVVASGFMMNSPVEEASKKYPAGKFLIIDSVVAMPNVASAVFAEHEGSFLVGAVAGLKAKADGRKVIGFLGGMKLPIIEKFQAGFAQGVKTVYPDARMIIEYAGNFGDPATGKALARKIYDQGAYIIYHAAGATGGGVIQEASERSAKGDIRWVIGVDVDQYKYGLYGRKSSVLTSMMKRIDTAAYDVALMAKEGRFPGGQVLLFSVANKGVGLPVDNPNLSADILDRVKDFEGRIASGSLKVDEYPR